MLKVDTLIITETKLDSAFPSLQFKMNGYSEAYQFDRNRNGGEDLIYIREDVPSKNLVDHRLPPDIESLFIKLNLQKNESFFCLYHAPS